VRFATKLSLPGRRFCREEEAIFGRMYRGDFEGGRPGDSGLGALSAARACNDEMDTPLPACFGRHVMTH